MMAQTLQQTESAPDAYNALPAVTLATAAWQRIEPYIAWRFSPRSVGWLVEGPGEWSPPLKPATVTIIEVWCERARDWEDITANALAAPGGSYWLPATGPYHFTATVGTAADDVPPAIVTEAVTRLANYFNAAAGKPGATSESVTAGSISTAYRRSADWRAQALQLSGAADLLRAYRRA